ncbi:MAG TPA: hypothetical protein VET88_15870 [Gammaproteobacteria bacterium]|nr:hypothetical protein [Gammaproteobacteria bacterium]
MANFQVLGPALVKLWFTENAGVIRRQHFLHQDAITMNGLVADRAPNQLSRLQQSTSLQNVLSFAVILHQSMLLFCALCYSLHHACAIVCRVLSLAIFYIVE